MRSRQDPTRCDEEGKTVQLVVVRVSRTESHSNRIWKANHFQRIIAFHDQLARRKVGRANEEETQIRRDSKLIFGCAFYAAFVDVNDTAQTRNNRKSDDL